MKQETPPLLVSLKDLYISSFLKAKGYPLHDAVLDHQRRTIFQFEDTPELSKELKKFYTDDALVSPSAFIEAFKALRSLAYQLSGDLKRINMNGDKRNGFQKRER